jgi:hypothetical protein
VPFDRRNPGLPGLQPRETQWARLRPLRAADKSFDVVQVCPRAERLSTGPGDGQHPGLLVAAESLYRLGQQGCGLRVDRVSGLGPVDRDDRHGSTAF